nr:MAG TPA: hypothetical protein [Caudoviricetes sp.]
MNLDQLQTRSLEFRAKIDGLTVEGIGVPYNREIDEPRPTANALA